MSAASAGCFSTAIHGSTYVLLNKISNTMAISRFGRNPRVLVSGLKRVVKRGLQKYLRWPEAMSALGSAPTNNSEDPQGDANRTLAATSQRALEAFLASPGTLTLGGYGHGPLVSVVLVLFNKAHLTYACLQHIEQIKHHNLEVIIVDNHSTDATPSLLAKLDGRVKILPQIENLHFLRACNHAFETLHAHSQFVALVNNDALLDASCITQALRVFKRWPDTGIVGGQILHLDGQLQEAGSLIFQDASCRGLGRRQSPWQPWAQVRRKVDYVSGCFFVIDTPLLRELGGFDQRFAPAYYEEADLCVSCWKHGRSVVYEPSCLLKHVEFASAGQSSGEGQQEVEQLMQKNQSLFLEKHRQWLLDQYQASDVDANPAIQHTCRIAAYPYRILWIDDKLPNPSHGAGFGRLNDIISGLADLGCYITLFATDLSEHNAPPDRLLHSLSSDYELMWAGLHDLSECLKQRKGFYTHIVASRRHNQDLLRECLTISEHDDYPIPQLIADVESLFSIRNLAQHHLNRTGRIAAAKDLSSGKDLSAEIGALKGFDQIWCVSQLEADLLIKHLEVRPHLVGHAFQAVAEPHYFETTQGLLFMGALNYPSVPNLDSLVWLADEVLPSLRQQLLIEPDKAPLTIMGPYRRDLVDSLVHRINNIWPVVHIGLVPSVEPIVRNHRVVLAPTRYAAGLPHKVQHSIAMATPVVTTELVVSQMGWTSGEGLLASNDPAEFARLIAQLYNNEDIWTQVQTAGLAKVRRECDPARLINSMAASLTTSKLIME